MTRNERRTKDDRTAAEQLDDSASTHVVAEARRGLLRGARRVVPPAGLVAVAMAVSECACAANVPARPFSDAAAEADAAPDVGTPADAHADDRAAQTDADAGASDARDAAGAKDTSGNGG